MKKYSQYFTTLYDEQKPTGNIGRGTHYTVLRAASWHSPNYDISPRAYHYDFVVIWDEDHDIRVIKCIEEIYLNGLLSKFLMFGERKAFFTAILSDHYNGGTSNNELAENIKWITANAPDGDYFTSELVALNSNNNSIIADESEKVTLYLNNIMMLWRIGGKPIPLESDKNGSIPFPYEKTVLS
jgi:hypothetical protein